MIGKVVNYRYEILEKCGDGNFFSVYKARDKVLNRLVAVKVLVPQYSENHEFADRLIGEAQTVTELSHPNLAKVIEADTQDGTYFVAAEYVRGINLKDRIRRTAPFAVSYAVDIAIAVAEALDYAHRKGIVHGDVRPHNILTSPEGQVKLTDFASASALAAFPTIREATMLRSVHYMAPEVLRGEETGPASDVYSLGVVLYEMLTGSVPFDGPTSAAIAARQIQDPVPSPQAMNPGVPALLNEIVMKAMQKNAAQRFASAAEFAAALSRVRDWLRTGQTPAPAQMVPRETAMVPDREYVYESQERSENFLKTAIVMMLVVIGIAVVTGVLVVVLTGGWRSDEVSVPDLVGKTWAQALEIADKRGIQIQEDRREYNEEYPEGQIYFTNPKAGATVRKTRPVVKVWVSKGPPMLTVPNVQGMHESEARRKIADAGFFPGETIPEHSDTVRAGMVIRQVPGPGQKLEPLKPIDIVVSSGPATEPEVPPPGVETPDGSSPEALAPDAEPRERWFPVSVSVPRDLSGPVDVRIEVADVYGQITVYENAHQPGDLISRKFRAFGENVEIRIYVGDTLAREVIYSGDRVVRDRDYSRG